jgi:molybdopterin synthase sulfur carrier subunit
MHWKLFANLAEAAGRKEVAVAVEGNATVQDALDSLLADNPELEPLVRTENGDLQSHIQLLVDGEDPFAEAEGFETTVEDEAELALFPPVSGG